MSRDSYGYHPTKQRIAHIRQMSNNGLGNRDIGEILNLTPNIIRRIKERNGIKCVPQRFAGTRRQRRRKKSEHKKFSLTYNGMYHCRSYRFVPGDILLRQPVIDNCLIEFNKLLKDMEVSCD